MAFTILVLLLASTVFAQAPLPELCGKEAPTCQHPGHICDLIKGECVPAVTTTGNSYLVTPMSSFTVKSVASTPSSIVCKDLHAPGRASDCPQKKHLCEDKLYYDLMTEQCPKTCGRCPGQIKGSTTETRKCEDMHAPGRTSDCPSRKHLCDHERYRQIMAIQCPKTCGKC
uniref:ShTK domain protein n=1 Tax=Steinernema glaseri TaxID=37863 RepID=A0A1I7Y0W3_9BILA